MAVVSNALFLTILVLFLGQGLGLLPDVPSSNGGVPTPSTVPSNLPRIMGIGCQTSSNDVDIHPLIAKQLSQQFCDELRGQRLGTGGSLMSLPYADRIDLCRLVLYVTKTAHRSRSTVKWSELYHYRSLGCSRRVQPAPR